MKWVPYKLRQKVGKRELTPLGAILPRVLSGVVLT